MRTRMHVLLFMAACAIHARCAQNEGPSDQLIATVSRVESGGNVLAEGDTNLTRHAYGLLQIRQPVCDDVNRRFGTKYRAEQCRGDKELSVKIFRRYMSMYATKNALGREPTDEDLARIWNGGPNGWRLRSTEKYWKKVMAAERPSRMLVAKKKQRGSRKERLLAEK